MLLEQLNATMPNGLRLPEPIGAICQYLELHGYPISGSFEVEKAGNAELDSWFRGDETMSNKLMVFGRGACGDTYALWLDGDPSPEDAPVVMLGSEGTFCALAENALEFCRLLCVGYSEVGLDDPGSPGSAGAETERFREFMVGRYGFEVPETGAELMQVAKERVPHFSSWVETWMAERQ